MFCNCRLLHRALYSSKIGNWSSVYCSPAFSSSQFNSAHSSENIIENNTSLENGAPTQLVRDVRRTEMIWKNQHNSVAFQKFLSERFLSNDGSPSYTINLLKVARDHATFTPSLVMNMFLNLSKCIQHNDIDFSPSFVEKTEALKYVLDYNDYALLQLFCKFFKISEEDKLCTEFIDKLIQERKLTEAAYLIGALNLHDMYAVKEIILPLLLAGKTGAVVDCISSRPDLQLEVAKLLDELIIIRKSETDTFESSLQSRRAIKILDHLVNFFKISLDQCKNLHYIRGRRALNLLIKRRTEQSIVDTTFEDMVMSIISENPNLKEHLIYKLVTKKDNETALKMVAKLNMNDYDLTKIPVDTEAETDLKSVEDRECLSEETPNENLDVGDNANHLTFDLKMSDVKFVDDVEKFVDCIQNVAENYKYIGIDTEWKPHFGLSRDRLSLIQLAVHDKVYILDMIALSNCLSPDHWNALMDNIFGNPKIMKLGCAIMADIEMILESNQGTQGKKVRFSHVLDMAIFYEKLEEVYPEQMGVDEEEVAMRKRTKGLSKLCEIVLGKPLNKEERLCDWEKRPLTESQLEYAALDAYCLLQIFDKLKEEAFEKGINFEHQVKVGVYLTAGQWRPSKKSKGLKNERGTSVHRSVPIHLFKVLVDSELENVSQQLRQLGADVMTLSSTDTPFKAVEISKNEGRILLCTSKLWREVQWKVPRRSSFRVANDDGLPVPVSFILQVYNVDLNVKDNLRRCLVCNSESGVHISTEELNFLQNQEANEDESALDIDVDISSFQRTVKDMIASGINVKFNNQRNNLPSGNLYSFLCTQCGTVQ